MKKITIVGIGYVGAPLAIAFLNRGFDVTGYDISEKVVERAKRGIYPEVDTNYEIKPIKATTNPKECIPEADFIIICVPNPITKDKEPDTRAIISASRTISKYLKPGQTVIIETTGYPGMTEELVKPILEESGLEAGVDFGLAYSPERIDPDNKKFLFEDIPKLVAGINDKYGKIVADLYAQIVKKVIYVRDIKVAESSKLFENTFRQVNIAFVNEMSMLFEKMGINTYDVIKTASTKPFAFLPHYPGPGVGGECIPTDPFYLHWKAKEIGLDVQFIDLADKINTKMPLHVADLVKKSSDKNDTVLILGVTYKPNISDTRNAPAETIIKTLKEDGWNVKYFDHLVKDFLNITSEENLEKAIEEADTVVLTVGHKYFKDFRNLNKLLEDKVVVDTCNFFERGIGKKYIGLGKPVGE